MSTNNFAIAHRCVVVSDEDLERENYPALGEFIGNQGFRDYPATALLEFENDYLTGKIALVSGYYSGANIDFVDTETGDITDDFSFTWDAQNCTYDGEYIRQSQTQDEYFKVEDPEYPGWYRHVVTRKELLKEFKDDVAKEIAVSFSYDFAYELVEKWMTKFGFKMSDNEEVSPIADFCYDHEDDLVAMIREVELEDANKIIDKIKDDYQYPEYNKVAQFSNGEAVYEKVEE